MYDNILSVKAPFIMDLFSIVEEVVEIYSQRIDNISQNSLDERIKNEITKNYLERMTYDSLKMSYKTFLKLLTYLPHSFQIVYYILFHHYL